MIRACIERGASLSETIHATVHHFRPELIEMLVKAGADVNEMDSMATPLFYVRFCTDIPKEQRKKRRETEKILVRLGAIEKHDGKIIEIDISP